MRILIAHNPSAGSFQRKRLDALMDSLASKGGQCKLVDSHANSLSRQAEKSDHVCVFGGDGTLRDVLERLKASHIAKPVSVYPSGTINLVAREAGYAASASKFSERIFGTTAQRRHYSVDYGGKRTANGLFLACASIGPDSYSVARLSDDLKARIGRFAYVVAFAKQFMNWQRHRLAISADGQWYGGEAVYILKGQFFAGPWTLDRKAALDRDEMRILIMPTARRRDFVKLALSAFTGGRFDDPDWLRLSCREITIRANEAVPVQADGDIVGTLPMELSLSKEHVHFA